MNDSLTVTRYWNFKVVFFGIHIALKQLFSVFPLRSCFDHFFKHTSSYQIPFHVQVKVYQIPAEGSTKQCEELDHSKNFAFPVKIVLFPENKICGVFPAVHINFLL